MLKVQEGDKTRYTYNFSFSVLLEESFPFCMYLHIPLYRKQNLRFICLPLRKKKILHWEIIKCNVFLA